MLQFNQIWLSFFRLNKYLFREYIVFGNKMKILLKKTSDEGDIDEGEMKKEEKSAMICLLELNINNREGRYPL